MALISSNTGKPKSDETRRKISEALKALPPRKAFSEEHKRKIGEANSRRTLSEETRRKIAISRTGQSPSPETRALLSERMSSRKKPLLQVETGVVFDSIAETVRAIGTDSGSLLKAVRTGTRCRGNHWRYAATAEGDIR
jgi:hypothetical protein